MTKQQSLKLQSLTCQLAARHERMIFSIIEVGNTIIFSANDIEGLQWFEREHTLYAHIGPRGGFTKYAGTINL